MGQDNLKGKWHSSRNCAFFDKLAFIEYLLCEGSDLVPIYLALMVDNLVKKKKINT